MGRAGYARRTAAQPHARRAAGRPRRWPCPAGAARSCAARETAARRSSRHRAMAPVAGAGATAGQAETRGFLLAHAIGDQLTGRRWLIGHDPGEQVVLDAATGHRALDAAVAALSSEPRARRAAPGFDHRVEHHRVTVTQPVAGTPQHCQIDTVHRSPRIHCLHRLAGMQAVTDGCVVVRRRHQHGVGHLAPLAPSGQALHQGQGRIPGQSPGLAGDALPSTTTG